MTLEGSPYRGKKAVKPSGWGIYSQDGALIQYHASEEVVRRWAKNMPTATVENIAARAARLEKEARTGGTK